jgi:hypothetical protein
MSENDAVRVLLAHIDKHLVILDEIFGEFELALDNDVQALGRTNRTGVMIASIIESHYTCTETIFFRISQYFENSLGTTRWHKELLDRMTLEVDKTRPRIISDSVYEDLAEMLRFRHFKRYYLGFAYDWERLDLLIVRMKRVHAPLKSDLAGFCRFLKKLADNR